VDALVVVWVHFGIALPAAPGLTLLVLAHRLCGAALVSV